MNCDDVKFYEPLYLSGELDATTLADMDRHLQSCAACKLLLERDAELDSAMRIAILADTPDATRVRSNVLAAVYATQADDPHRKFPMFWRALIVSTTILCLSAGIVVANWRNHAYFVAASRDHIDDVVQVVAKTGWRTTEPEIRAYLTERFPNEDGLARLTMPGYQLVKARDCHLREQSYVHLIYEKDGHQISLYLLPHGRNVLDRLATASVFVPVRSRSEHGLNVTEGDSSAYNVFVVGDLPFAEAKGLTTRVLASLA